MEDVVCEFGSLVTETEFESIMLSFLPDLAKYRSLYFLDGQWGQWSPWRCVCPPQRIRLCVTATNQTAKECGPGNALEYDKCDSPQQKFSE